MVIPAGHKVPRTMLRLPAVVILLSVLLTLLACGQTATPVPTVALEPAATPTPVSAEMPTAGLKPAATEIVAPLATEAPVGGGDGDDGIRGAVQQLFDSWNRALEERDAALFHSLLTQELAGSCELEKVQSWLDLGEFFLAGAEVRSVFLDVADPGRASVEIVVGQSAGGLEVPLPFPWPVALEEGQWRAGFPAGLTAQSCPYSVSEHSIEPSGPDGGEREYPQIPGLALERHGDVLAAVPGARVLDGSIKTDSSTSSFSTGGIVSSYDNQVNIHAEMETEMAAAEVVSHFRDRLKHPSWEITGEGSLGEFGWLSWTVPDSEGRLWQGRLVVAPLLRGWWHVWLALYSNDPDEPG